MLNQEVLRIRIRLCDRRTGVSAKAEGLRCILREHSPLIHLFLRQQLLLKLVIYDSCLRLLLVRLLECRF